MTLSPQEKLALALTSAGSQRALAKLVGVSHQKIGRWLREGVPATIDPETGYQIRSAGVKHIPDDALDAIDTAFDIHKDIAKAQALHDELPYDSKAPVFARRVDHSDGTRGNRVLVDSTEYISDDLRNRIIEGASKSKKYVHVSVRSLVNLRDYAGNAASIELDKIKSPKKGRAQRLRDMTDSFVKELESRTLKQSDYFQKAPMFTSKETLTFLTDGKYISDPRSSIKSLNSKLRTKMQPAAVEGGYADQILYQVFTKPAVKNGNTKKKLTRK